MREIWNIEDLIDLENWNLKWRISRRIPNSPLIRLGLSFGVVSCLEVFPTPFNSINSLLIITLNFTPIHVYPRLKHYMHLWCHQFKCHWTFLIGRWLSEDRSICTTLVFGFWWHCDVATWKSTLSVLVQKWS